MSDQLKWDKLFAIETFFDLLQRQSNHIIIKNIKLITTIFYSNDIITKSNNHQLQIYI